MNTAITKNGLHAQAIRTAFGKTTVLHDVSLAVAPGETLVLFGPSGSGKTVLLRAIAGLDPNATGHVTIAGRDVTTAGPEGRSIGVAFQNFALYPHMSARENIASPLRARKLPEREIDEKVSAIAKLLKIDHVLAQQPRALSNGQKQRTALARALVGSPKILLMDDPLRNVDAKLRYEMRMELPRLLRRANAAAVYVTQDYREAMALGDRIAVLIDGHIVQLDDPERVYAAPASVAVARLFGDPPLNLVPCRPTLANDGLHVSVFGLDLTLSMAGALAGREAMLGLRPDSIAIFADPQPGAVAATIAAVTPLHGKVVLLLRTQAGDEILASQVGRAPETGSTIWFRPETDTALLYDTETGLLAGEARTATEEAA
ncbi:ABC transporter ATP-binding protein [Acidisoma silvae]|uniref:ABC transporter ATP-binding protein n=1 Tax=Acidisoma silvae TaxID=2802396 RepID=A0A964E1Z9_9PROT|nr:ABC transporter ATP-binding protein [Acidisoma silvae]MCB8878298.1 ABC transporter ATP-binding protein [Acidisoma silvae]